MSDERELTVAEIRWANKLKRVLRQKPGTIEVYVGLNDVAILPSGGMDRSFENSRDGGGEGSSDNIFDDAPYSFSAKITGDPAGL